MAALLPRLLVLLTLLWWLLPQGTAGAATDHSYPSVTAWPLATHSADADGSTTNLLLGILHHQERGSYERTAIRPWIFNLETDADRDFRELSLLLDVLHVEREGEEFRRHLFPVYWHGHEGERRWFHLWPLYGDSQKADGARTRSTLYPFFSYTTGPAEGDWSAGYLWPLGASRRTSEEASDRFLPFWWRHTTPERRSGMVFPWLWLDHGDSRTRAILPLWWWQRTPERSAGLTFPYAWLEQEGKRNDVLIPLWWSQRTPERRFSLLVPLYLGWRNPDSEGELILPLWYASRSAERRFSLLAPLYLGWRNPDSQGELILPLWYASRSADRQATVLAPIYLDWRSADETRLKLVLPVYADHRGEKSATRLIVPFYFRRHNDAFDSTLRYWFPFFGRYERAGETRRYYLFPLYAHIRDEARGYDSHFALWPLVHHETLPDARDTWVLPLFRHKRTAEESDTMAGLLWWSGRSPQREYSLLAPLYWHWRHAEGAETHLVPLYSDIRRADGYRKRFFLGPLTILTEDPAEERRQTDVLWPLVSHRVEGETTHARALPFYWYRRRGESVSRHLIPFYSDIRLADGYRKRFYLGPLAIRTDDPAELRSQTDVLWPLISHREQGETTHTRVLPFWWRDNEPGRTLSLGTLALLPPYYLHKEKPGRSLFHLWPFYGVRSEERFREDSVIWPLFRYGRTPDGEKSSWQALLAYGGRAPEKSHAGVFPLWHHARKGERTRDLSLLHWHERDPDVSATTFALLHLGNPDWSLFNRSKEEMRRHSHLFPLYSLTSRDDSDSTRLWVLWPLYFYEREGARSEQALLWKLLYREQGPELSQSGFLWRLVRSRRDSEGSLFEFNPFYYRETRADGSERYTAWLGGLYATRATADGTEHRLLWFLSW